MTQETRVLSTRYRERLAKNEARYDDIFSAVTKAVQDEGTFGGISRRLIEENSVSTRMRLFSQSSHSSSEDETVEKRKSQEVVMLTASGRPQRRAALAARSALTAMDCQNAMAEKERKQQRRVNEEVLKRMRMAERRRRARKHKVEIIPRFECAQCTSTFERHMHLHKHILEKHNGSGCKTCDQPCRVLRTRHQCFKCALIAPNLERHLIEKHYAVSTRPGALLECSRCPRTFEHLKDVMQHEKCVHGLMHKIGCSALIGKKTTASASTNKLLFFCRSCGDGFESRYLRDQHFTSHFQSVIDSVWQTIERMQDESEAGLLLHECPLCGSVMSNRKSFRVHVVHRHLMYDAEALAKLVGPGVKEEELKTVKEHIAMERRKYTLTEDTSETLRLPMENDIKKE